MTSMNPGGKADLQLSVIIALVSDTTERHYDLSHLAGCLMALAQQVDGPDLEIIVPYPSHAQEVEELKADYPATNFIAVHDLRTYDPHGSGREHHDELRARGIEAAQGNLIALLEDHARPDSNWSKSIVQAHQQSCAAVGGAIENGIDRPLNWAVYFCDFWKYHNPIPAGETSFASDANVSYKRAALEKIRSVWQNSFHETDVNGALLSLGEKLLLSAEMIVYQHRSDLHLRNALKERYIWGRSYADSRGDHLGLVGRLLYVAVSFILPAILTLRMSVDVFRKGRRINAFAKAFPLILLLTVFWSAGELSGYLIARTDAPH